jgi:hypothetical protein
VVDAQVEQVQVERRAELRMRSNPRTSAASRCEVHRTRGQKGLRRKNPHQFTAIDDCTRLRVLRAYPRCDQKTAISFVDDVMAKLPFQ